MNEGWQDNILNILFSCGLMLYALYKLWKIIVLVRRRATTESWTVTTGTVYDRDVKVHRSGKGGTYYEPVIMYLYTVMGEEFRNKLSLGTAWFEMSADKTVGNIGDTIEVRYNPDKPKEHISSEEKVRVGAVAQTLLFLVFGIIFLYLAVFGYPFPTTPSHGGK